MFDFKINKNIVDVVYEGNYLGLPVVFGKRKDIKGVNTWMTYFNDKFYADMFYSVGMGWRRRFKKSISKIMESGQDGCKALTKSVKIKYAR